LSFPWITVPVASRSKILAPRPVKPQFCPAGSFPKYKRTRSVLRTRLNDDHRKRVQNPAGHLSPFLRGWPTLFSEPAFLFYRWIPTAFSGRPLFPPTGVKHHRFPLPVFTHSVLLRLFANATDVLSPVTPFVGPPCNAHLSSEYKNCFSPPLPARSLGQRKFLFRFFFFPFLRPVCLPICNLHTSRLLSPPSHKAFDPCRAIFWVFAFVTAPFCLQA